MFSYKQMSGGGGGCGGFDGTEYMEDAMDNNSQQEHQFADMVSIASDMCKAELTTTPPAGSPAGGGCPCFNGGGGVHHAHHHDHPSASVTEPGGRKRRRSDDDSSDAAVAVAADSDEHFALSCVAALRRLPVRKNAETRMRILHMLYEAEYGEQPAFR